MAETTSRILSLLSLLQTHRQWPGGELATRLGVTERTLRRDIERLRELGYQVEATRGVAGGYRLEAGSQLPPLLLNDEEAVTMAIGLRLAASQGLADGETTTLSALAKFEQVLPPALRERVNALADHLLPQTTRPGNGGDGAARAGVSQELVGQLALACRDRERIRFHYVAADGAESDRVVEPHTVVCTARTWFFVCWDVQRADWRTFRVDRMSSFFATRVHVEPRELPATDAAEFVRRALRSLRSREHAEVLLALPVAEVRAHFGSWADDAESAGPRSTRWPVQAESFDGILSILAWLPPGAEYELRGSPELLAFVANASARMARAVSPGAANSRVARSAS